MCSSPIFYNLFFFVFFSDQILSFYFYSQSGADVPKCHRRQGGSKLIWSFFLRKFIRIERFKSTFKTHLKKWKKWKHITMDDLRKAISGDIWKATVEKSQTNVASATMNHLRKAIWGDIWKRTLEKSETNATNVTIHHLRQAIWGLKCWEKKNKKM